MLMDRIKELALKRGKSLKEVAVEIGLSENAIYKWTTQSPNSETLEKVADYFNVTTDYLLGRDKDSINDIAMMFRQTEAGVPEDKKEEFREDVERYMDFLKNKLND